MIQYLDRSIRDIAITIQSILELLKKDAGIYIYMKASVWNYPQQNSFEKVKSSF